MSAGRGELFVDGNEVPRRELERMIGRCRKQLVSAGIGPGRLVRVPIGSLELIVVASAALEMGAAVSFPEPHMDRSTTARVPIPDAIAHAVGPGAVEIVPSRDQPDRLGRGAAVVFWTAGSTGEPKGVILSHQALEYQVEATSGRLQIGPEDGLCVPLPLAHAYGFGVLMLWRRLGPSLHVETRLSATALLKRLENRRITSIDGIPPMYSRLLEQARVRSEASAALRRLRLRGCGGDILPLPLRSAFAEAIGAPLLDGYGLSEAGPNVAIAHPASCERPSAGPPLEGTEVRIAGDCEVQVRSPSLMSGYFDDPGGSRETLTDDGWLRTGDVGEIDANGEVRLTGRKKHVLIVNGKTFPPTLIEEELRALPGVRDAAVLGIPTDKGRGDLIAAFVEAEAGSSAPSPPDLRSACRRALPSGLVPRTVSIVRLPRLPSGKVDRRALELPRPRLEAVG
jgi:acyl-CoA synthetase (AMP-forming)/AMP-acid ligase II